VTGESVYDKALRLRAEIRRIDEGASAEQAARSAAHRVQELRSALADLTSQVSLARALTRYSETEVPLGDVRNGLFELQQRASTGLPSDQAFDAARRKVTASAEDLARRSQEVWRTWTSTSVDNLPTNRMAGLDQARQRSTRQAVDQLAALRKRTKPSSSDVVEFHNTLDAVLDELAAAKNAPDELLDLLTRFDGQQMTLRDITDSEIALLREHGMDSEIEIRRKQG
jgi:hypothetical protein